MPHRSQNLRSHARRSSKGFPNLYLILGLLTLLAATCIFAAIAEDVVTGDPLTIHDLRFSSLLHTHQTAALTKVMVVVTNAHSPLGVSIVTLVVGAYFWTRRQRYWVFTLILAVYGGMLLNVILKHLFLRPRPHFDNPILTFTTYSFPSGHTLMATVLYGTLCAYIVLHLRVGRWRWIAISGALFMIGLAGFSRIYLGAHYLSDVLAAIVEGLAWLAFCLIAVLTIRRRQARRQSGVVSDSI